MYFSRLGSVNVLICLASVTGDGFLWNPTIRKYKKLSHSICILTSNSDFIYECCDDYKVVCIVAVYLHGSFCLLFR